MGPRLRYVHTDDGVGIAYWTMGEGRPLVQTPLVPFSHIEAEWQHPGMRRWYERLSRGAAVVRYDARGTARPIGWPTTIRSKFTSATWRRSSPDSVAGPWTCSASFTPGRLRSRLPPAIPNGWRAWCCGVLVANAMRELGMGKGFIFVDRGDFAPRGMGEPVRVWELVS